MRLHLKIVTIYVVMCLSFVLVATELKTAAQNSPPKYYLLKDYQMGGICVDIIHAIEQEESSIHIVGYQTFLPFKRLQNQLTHNKIDFFVGFKKTAKREKKYKFLNIPLYHLRYVMAMRTDDPLHITSFEDIRKITTGDNAILSVFGTAGTHFLIKQKGLTIDDGARNIETAVQKLLLHRGRFLFYHDLGLKHVIKCQHLESKIKLIPVTFLDYNHYIAFSKKTSDSVIKRVEKAVRRLQKKGVLDKIYKKYGIMP